MLSHNQGQMQSLNAILPNARVRIASGSKDNFVRQLSTVFGCVEPE